MARGSWLLSRRSLLAAAATAIAGGVVAVRSKRSPTLPPVTLPPLAPDARHVVLVSIDGMQPKYYLEPDAHGLRVPTIRKLIANGALTEGAESVWPTLTYPAHTTMITGVDPAQHGIVSNYEFDPYGKLHDAWMWSASEIHGPTLWSEARKAGLRVGASYWPVTVGADIDFLFPQIWDKKTSDDDALLRSLTKPPELAGEMERVWGALPAEHRTDRERADAAVHLLRTRRPELLLVYFTDYDTKAHPFGPDAPESLATLEAIDEQLGRVVDAVEAAGATKATTFVIVSDHGFANVRRVVRPSVALREAGLLDVDAHGRVTAYRACVTPAGGLAGVVLGAPGDTKTASQVLDLFTSKSRDPGSGIARVHMGDEIHALGGFPDAALVLEAAPDAYFAGGSAGPFVSGSPNRGTHGFPPHRPEMRASCFVSGRAVRAGARLGVVSLRDIAPTVAHLLGFSFPSAKGRYLEELFTS